MKQSLAGHLVRWLASAGIVAVIVYACAPIPSIEPLTVGMLLLLVVLTIAARWGTGEAAAASVVGGLLFDYRVLPPPGIDLGHPQHWAALGAFLVTSLVVGRYSVRLKERAREAAEEAARTEAARASEELRSAMLDALAHDFKTPLTSIKAAVTALLAGNDPASRELLTIIDEETDRLNRLSSQAIELERAGIGMLRPEKKPHDLRRLIEDTIEEMQSVLKSRHVRIELDENLPRAEFDLLLIKEVLRQLLDNARKYSPQDSPIGIECHRSGDAVVIEVADRGPGVPDETRGLIFEKFCRGPQGAEHSPGVGLGLAIAQRIVKAHGGEIGVENHPQRGPVFHFSLPCGTTAHAKKTVEAAAAASRLS